jgi:hypothetical protein
MKDVGDVILTIALAMLGVLGLLMSLCGGAFVVLTAREAPAMLWIAGPSLAVGLLFAWLAVRGLRRGKARRDAAGG